MEWYIDQIYNKTVIKAEKGIRECKSIKKE